MRWRFIAYLVGTALLGLCMTSVCSAQPLSETRTIVAEWEYHDPAPNQIRAIAADRNSVWVASEADVKRYSIHTYAWRRYTTEDGLASEKINDITVTPDDTVWFATDQGLSRYQRGIWTTYTRENSGLPSNRVAQVESETDGSLWLRGYADGTGVTHFDGITWETLTTENSGLAHNCVSALAIDTSGDIWCGTAYEDIVEIDWLVFWFFARGAGISRYDGANWTTYTAGQGLITNRIEQIDADAFGRLWARCSNTENYLDGSTQRGGTALYDGGEWSEEDMGVNCLACGRQSVCWASRDGDLYRSSGEGYVRVYDDIKPSRMAVDALGQLWIYPCGRADSRVGGESLGVLANGNLSEVVYGPSVDAEGLTCTPKGEIVFGGGAWIQAYEVGTGWGAPEEAAYIRPDSASQTANGQCDQVTVDPYGRLWVTEGSTQEGSSVVYRDDTGWHWLSDPAKLLGASRLLAQGPDLWVGHVKGSITRWDGVTWRAYWSDLAQIPDAEVRALAADRQGRTWAAFAEPLFGVSCCTGDEWTRIAFSAEGLGGERSVGSDWYVNAIACDTSGAMWFAGEEFVSRLHGTDWTTYYAETTGLSGEGNVGLLADSQGRVWAYGKVGQLSCYEDGVWRAEPRDPITDGFDIRKMVEGKDGTLWMTSDKGIFSYKPFHQVEATHIPLVETRNLWRGEETHKEFAIPRQTGVFTVGYEASPRNEAMNGVTGLCAGEVFWFDDLACIVRFNQDGMIDALDGDGYVAAEAIPYDPEAWYTIRMVVDVAAHRYDAHVVMCDGTERVIGEELAFRSEQAEVPLIDHWAIWAGEGTHYVRNLVVASVP